MFEEMLPLSAIQSVVPGSIVYPPGGRFGPRIQNDLQFVFLHTGSLDVAVDGASSMIAPGHVLFLKPGHLEYFQFAQQQQTWHRWIAIHTDPLPGGILAMLESLPAVQPITSDLNRLMDLLLAVNRRQASDGSILRSLAHSALELYYAQCADSQKAQLPPSVASAKAYIHAHYEEELSLSRLADQAGVAPEHLVRLFAKHEEMTPMKYVWHYRVARAQDMLIHTGLPVGEIALRCGFKTSYHFSRMMKLKTSRTPTEIRQSAWSEYSTTQASSDRSRYPISFRI